MRPTPYDGELIRQVRSRKVLKNAWKVIRDNGLSIHASTSTKKQVNEFLIQEDRNLERIQEKLRSNNFTFEESTGFAITKKKGSSAKRPLVIFPIETRIIQRAILDTLLRIDTIDSSLKAGHNFGGLSRKGLGVPAAIERALTTSQQFNYFIRTDIRAFFDNAPREQALLEVFKHSPDQEFNSLIRAATNVELKNARKLAEDFHLFPTETRGIAQGSCLSPLLCNLLLTNFDAAMNSNGIVCIRYIDDFILFGKSRAAARKALAFAKSILKKLELDLYDPLKDSEKAEEGFTKDGFEFLGCKITPESVRPSEKNRKAFTKKIQSIYDESILYAKKNGKDCPRRLPQSTAIELAGITTRGWGNTFGFCFDKQFFTDLNIHLTDIFLSFTKRYRAVLEEKADAERALLLGYLPIQECNLLGPDGACGKAVIDFKEQRKKPQH